MAWKKYSSITLKKMFYIGVILLTCCALGCQANNSAKEILKVIHEHKTEILAGLKVPLQIPKGLHPNRCMNTSIDMFSDAIRKIKRKSFKDVKDIILANLGRLKMSKREDSKCKETEHVDKLQFMEKFSTFLKKVPRKISSVTGTSH